ncbi:hypothetical protein [Butyrivibrio sp. VCB2001]|uniref:hypothetical protein n=1 Tax=Butyrivibrio sp. VCB2001 TaxID=1280667 RepID=UPI0003FB8C3B|nr:hypothetical protein [Butyrivibrio sp. VCB2001]
MKLKYYLRGMGIGIILTAIVMGFALGGRKATMSDAEVIKRAKALGMIESSAEVLTQTQSEDSEVESDDASSSNQALDQIGEKIPEEVNTEIALSDPPVSEVAEEKEETENKIAESSSSSDASTDNKSEEETSTAAESESEEVSSAAETSAEEAASTESTSAETTKPSEETVVSNSGTKQITIPGGMGSDGVAALLAREGIVDDAVAFNKYLVENRIDRIIRSGTKSFPENATYEQVAKIITTG